MIETPCKKCGEIDRYPKGRCRPCTLAVNAKWQKANPDAVKVVKKRWAAKQRENNPPEPKQPWSCKVCGSDNKAANGCCRPCSNAKRKRGPIPYYPKGVELTQTLLKKYLNYDPESGIFRWLIKPARHIRKGDQAGALSCGYVNISIGGRNYGAHRLAWLYMNGELPSVEVDHINCIRNDNRWINIRLTEDFPNNQNIRQATSRSRTGVLGVSMSGSGYRAIVRLNDKSHYSTTFKTTGEAYEAYVNMKRKLHPGCTL